MNSTSKFDANNKEIFAGDKVIKGWGWIQWEGVTKSLYQIHTITIRDAHMMGNGKMHDDGNGKIYCLGQSYNFWDGNMVKKITEDEAQKIGIQEDQLFFYNNEGVAIKCTDQHFMGLSDEDWQKEIKRRVDTLFGVN